MMDVIKLNGCRWAPDWDTYW